MVFCWAIAGAVAESRPIAAIAIENVLNPLDLTSFSLIAFFNWLGD
jgi:hypothetical protein